MSEIADFINAQYDRLEEKLDAVDHGQAPAGSMTEARQDIESKREILKRHYVVGFDDEDGHDIGRGCAECGYSAEYSDRGGWCETVRILAAPFSGEPDYKKDWAV